MFHVFLRARFVPWSNTWLRRRIVAGGRSKNKLVENYHRCGNGPSTKTTGKSRWNTTTGKPLNCQFFSERHIQKVGVQRPEKTQKRKPQEVRKMAFTPSFQETSKKWPKWGIISGVHRRRTSRHIFQHCTLRTMECNAPMELKISSFSNGRTAHSHS